MLGGRSATGESDWTLCNTLVKSSSMSEKPVARINDLLSPSVGLLAAKLLDVKLEKERWQGIAQDWYAQGLADTPSGKASTHSYCGFLWLLIDMCAHLKFCMCRYRQTPKLKSKQVNPIRRTPFDNSGCQYCSYISFLHCLWYGVMQWPPSKFGMYSSPMTQHCDGNSMENGQQSHINLIQSYVLVQWPNWFIPTHAYSSQLLLVRLWPMTILLLLSSRPYDILHQWALMFLCLSSWMHLQIPIKSRSRMMESTLWIGFKVCSFHNLLYLSSATKSLKVWLHLQACCAGNTIQTSPWSSSTLFTSCTMATLASDTRGAWLNPSDNGLKSLQRLWKALLDSSLALPLLIQVVQQRQPCMFKAPDAHLKSLASLYDTVSTSPDSLGAISSILALWSRHMAFFCNI